MQREAVRARPDRLIPDPALVESREHLREVFEFFTCKFGQGFLQKSVVRIRKEQFDRGTGGLLFTMRMIEQHLIEVRAGPR